MDYIISFFSSTEHLMQYPNSIHFTPVDLNTPKQGVISQRLWREKEPNRYVQRQASISQKR